jgi:hypothetical protein
MEVKLPDSLEGLGDAEKEELAAQCAVPAADLARVVRGGLAAGEPVGASDEAFRRASIPPPIAQRRQTPAPVAVEEPRAPRRPWLRLSPRLAAGIGVVGAAAIAFGVWYAVTHLRDPHPTVEAVEPQFAQPIPIASATRQASDVVAILADDRWASEGAGARKRQLEAALGRLPPGADALVIKDTAGRIRATAQRGEKGRVVVKLF